MVDKFNKGVLSKTDIFCKNKNHRLLYLAASGSRLIGTNTENSDYDYKGIYAPSHYDLVNGRYEKSFSFDFTIDEIKVEVELFSIQFFIHDLIRNVKTEGLELLFSHTNTTSKVFCDPVMVKLFTNKKKLFDINDVNPFNGKSPFGYAHNMEQRYVIKFKRYSKLQDILDFCKDIISTNPFIGFMKLCDFHDEILNRFGDGDLCYEVESNGAKALSINAKVHQSSIKFLEFFERLEENVKKYGSRVAGRRELGSADWKALCHCLKAIYEIKSLFTNNEICFPFVGEQQERLLNTKLGLVEYDQVSEWITTGKDELDEIIKIPISGWKHDVKFVTDFIYNIYFPSIPVFIR